MSTSMSPIAQTIDVLSREKNIDPNVIIAAIEEAVIKAARKQFNAEQTGEELRARYDPETGDIDLFALMTVVEEVQNPATEISLADVVEMGIEGAEVGDQLEFPKPKEELGRIAAQTAKQIIFQKVRETERKNVYDEYIGRLGELVNGFVKRFEGGRLIVDFGKLEALLPKSEQSRVESFSQGERLRVVINNVLTDSKGPQVEVSRTSPELLKRLFEMEVPEIYDGTVQIKAAVREPGERAKIAVASTERDVDPVGACVGMKGSRVQAIIRELRGEKIDIIEWSDEPSVFAANALSPAKVNQVRITDIEHRQMEVIVNEDQLSLAIGKRGQNVRLATKLVGWNIDIRSEEELKREVALQMGAMIASGEAVPLERLEGMNPAMVATLAEHGIPDIESLANATVDDVAATEVEQMSADELLLQGAGRDLRPDTITPAPDIFSAEAAVIQNSGAFVEEERPNTLDVETEGIEEPTVRESDEEYEDSPVSPRADFASEASAPEVQVSSEPSLAGESAPTVENHADDEAADASSNE